MGRGMVVVGSCVDDVDDDDEDDRARTGMC